MQHEVEHVFGQLLDRRVQTIARFFEQRLDLLHVERVHAGGEILGPRHDRAFAHRLVAVGDDEAWIDLDLRTQTGALRTSAVGRVEREHPRGQLFEREPALQTGELFGEAQLLFFAARLLRERDQQPLGELERGLDRIGQPLAYVRLDDEPVDHDLDRVLALLVEFDLLAQVADLAVDADAGVAVFDRLLEQLLILAFASAHHRREDLQTGAFRQRRDLVDDLLGALRSDGPAAVGAMRVPDSRVEQPQVIVYLGDRTDGRARIAAGRFLVDRDRGREAFDVVDVRLLHLTQELARIGRQRFDVAALALGVDRIEGERALARTGEPGDDDQLVARQRQVDVLEIVLARALDDDRL